MRKQFLVIFIAVMMGILMLSPNALNALTFSFYDVADGGTTTAIMNISSSGNTLTVTIDNTSPTLLDDLSGPNAPGITGYGFDLDPDSLSIVGPWTLKAYTTASSTTQIDIGPSGTGEWTMGTGIGGITLDYLPNTFGGVSGALFNPAAEGSAALPDGSNSVYYTTAVLTINFNTAPTLVEGEWSPFVRMQNVGDAQDGSTKTPGTSVPDASIMLLLGSSLMGLGVFGRKSKRS